MSDLEDVPAETPLSPEEAVIRRHRREKRDLQGKILAMKKAVTKNDKKKKKDISGEIIRMEADLAGRHKLELDSFRLNLVETKPVVPLLPILEKVAEISLDGVSSNTVPALCENSPTPGSPRISKAQKRREKRSIEERERQQRIERETNILIENSDKKKEETQLEEILKDMNLKVFEVSPDGNCLYTAVSHQLDYHHSISESITTLRNKTSSHLFQHRDDFVNYLDENIANSQEKFESYCKDIAETSCWGGEIEVKILSEVLRMQIRIIQAEGPCVVFGEKYQKPSLDLIFHRHMLQLGAHYNSAISRCEFESNSNSQPQV